MKLNEIRDNEGAHKKRMRVGRGPGSGKGKTAGRGIKGQTSRSGVALGGYEGGQMPLYRRLPKRGFSKPNRLEFAVVNLGQLQALVDAGKLKAGDDITEDALIAAGATKRKLDGIRLLAKGELTSALNLTVAGASRTAVEAIERAGGKITLTRPPSTNQSGAHALVVNGESDGPSDEPAEPDEPGPLDDPSPLPSPVPGRNAQQSGTGQFSRNVQCTRSRLRASPMFAPSTVV